MKITPLVRQAAEILDTPFLALDLSYVENNYKNLKKSINNVDVYYAVKANSHTEILTLLKNLGSSFDAASKGEIDKLLSLGVDPNNISFGNTIKKESDIKYAWENGITMFAVDSEMEVEKIARNAPQAKVYGRISTSSNDADWPLSDKFGTDVDHVISILEYAHRKGLSAYGVSFHVGSQSYNKHKWKEAILNASEVFEKLALKGIHLKLLNLGGGMPVQHVKPIPEVKEIGDVINESINEYLYWVEGLKVITEPGRSMVGNAGIMASRVLLRSRKGTKNWVYLDVGVFHGLMETIENFRYEVVVDKKENHETMQMTLAGPSCDSVDTIYDEVELPIDVGYNDVVYFMNTGAYTIEYASPHFNGITPPEVFTIEELQEAVDKKLALMAQQ